LQQDAARSQGAVALIILLFYFVIIILLFCFVIVFIGRGAWGGATMLAQCVMVAADAGAQQRCAECLGLGWSRAKWTA
jgi:hypothetical protein